MKFRISISQEQLEWILACPDCPADLRKQLKIHSLKISEGLVKPAYEIKPETIRIRKEATLKEKYDTYLMLKNSNQSIPLELQEAYMEYRYLNDLMSAPEMEVYENEALGGLT